MNLSERGAVEIVSHEAIVLSPYFDSVGVLTIFVGHTAAAGEPLPSRMWNQTYTAADALKVFRKDVERFEAQVRLAFTRPLTQAQFDAAVSFHFNTGAIKKASWVRKFNEGDIAGARKSFMDWRKPAEIIPRRQKERDLFFDGKYSGDGLVSIYPADKSGRVQWSQGKRVDLLSMLAQKPQEAPKPSAAPTAPPKPVPATADAPKPSKLGWAAGIIIGLGMIAAGAWNAVVEITGYVSPWW